MQKKKQKQIIKKRFVDIGPLPKLSDISYTKPEVLKKFMSERNKILAHKLTRVKAPMQRVVTREVKKARIMALLPFTERHELK